MKTIDRDYQFLLEYQRCNKYARTLAEIGRAVGLSSKGSLCRVLKQLQGMGAIERRPGTPRGSYIPTEPNQFA